jgi:hypothetical protein
LSFYIKRTRVYILLRERENNGAPGVLHLFLAVDILAMPCKLHPTEKSILLAGITGPIIVLGNAVQILCLECD